MHLAILVKCHIIQHEFHDYIFMRDTMSSLIYFLELPKLNFIDVIHAHSVDSLNHVDYFLNLFCIFGCEYFAIFYHVD